MSQTAPTLDATAPVPGRLRRFACMMYEGVLLFAVVFLATYLFDTLTQSRHGLMLRHARQGWLFLAIGAYFLLCWRMGGQTLPMKTWHIRLVDARGAIPGLGRLVLRYVLMWVLPLTAAAGVWALSASTGWASANSLIVFTPFMNFLGTWGGRDGGQFLHDRLAGTRLVSTQPAAPVAA
ncbi:Probable transmembrane protein [plant metagenome]|uniref:Probable transmembrane protein n=1 Tax=plant metagenome TaxID=1297885 RepID=A0A484U945_9ZZZZ